MTDRTKSIFTSSVEWSDYSPHSPMRNGQLPCAVMIDEYRVEIGLTDIQVAQYQCNVPYDGDGWVKMDHGINARQSNWSDGGRVGRAGARVEILAPDGAVFLFESGCDDCSDKLGEVEESELVHDRAPVVVCDDCQTLQAEEDRLAEEDRQYHDVPHTLTWLARWSGIERNTLKAAVKYGRLSHTRDANTVLSTMADVDSYKATLKPSKLITKQAKTP